MLHLRRQLCPICWYCIKYQNGLELFEYTTRAVLEKIIRFFFEGTTQRADKVTIAIHVPNLAARVANFEGCQLKAVSLTHHRLALMNDNAAKATVLTMYMWRGVFH